MFYVNNRYFEEYHLSNWQVLFDFDTCYNMWIDFKLEPPPTSGCIDPTGYHLGQYAVLWVSLFNLAGFIQFVYHFFEFMRRNNFCLDLYAVYYVYYVYTFFQTGRMYSICIQFGYYSCYFYASILHCTAKNSKRKRERNVKDMVLYLHPPNSLVNFFIVKSQNHWIVPLKISFI